MMECVGGTWKTLALGTMYARESSERSRTGISELDRVDVRRRCPRTRVAPPPPPPLLLLVARPPLAAVVVVVVTVDRALEDFGAAGLVGVSERSLIFWETVACCGGGVR